MISESLVDLPALYNQSTRFSRFLTMFAVIHYTVYTLRRGVVMYSLQKTNTEDIYRLMFLD